MLIIAITLIFIVLGIFLKQKTEKKLNRPLLQLSPKNTISVLVFLKELKALFEIQENHIEQVHQNTVKSNEYNKVFDYTDNPDFIFEDAIDFFEKHILSIKTTMSLIMGLFQEDNIASDYVEKVSQIFKGLICRAHIANELFLEERKRINEQKIYSIEEIGKFIMLKDTDFEFNNLISIFQDVMEELEQKRKENEDKLKEAYNEMMLGN